MSFIRFESATDKEKARQELREAREEILAKAKADAERRAEIELKKKLSGEADWILPEVAKKFQPAKTSSKKAKKSSKKRKDRKKDKKKKHSSRKRKESSSSGSSSDSSDEESSSSDSDSDEKVKKSKKHSKKKSKKTKKSKKSKKKRSSSSSVSSSDEEEEKSNNDAKKDTAAANSSTTNTPLQRDSWMMDSSAFSLKTFQRENNAEARNSLKPKLDSYDPTKNVRELNPYWKTTGTGLPGYKKPSNNYDEEYDKRRDQSQPSSSTAQRSWKKMPAKDAREDASRDSESRHRKRTHSSSSSSSSSSSRSPSREKQDGSAVRPEAKAKQKEEHMLLTHTDQQGNCRPMPRSKNTFNESDLWGGRKGRKKQGKRVETHVDGERVRYFPDDDKYDIKQMFEREKYATAADSNLQFANIASKHKNPNDELDDIFTDRIRNNASEGDMERKREQEAIKAQERLAKQLEDCDKCIQSEKMDKKLMASMGSNVYLALPWHIGIQPGHCVIIPTQHVTCCTQLDEDCWEEVENFRKALTRMFAAQKKDVVFFEIANKLHRRQHLAIHCIPIDFSKSEMMLFYFKKAIEESEQEWSVNKQLVRLRGDKGLRNSIPKGLPYFWVHFGTDSGFAHVIEDESRFPANFALEIIGGMLNLEPSKWRKPRKEHHIIPKVKQFAEWWKDYDITQSTT